MPWTIQDRKLTELATQFLTATKKRVREQCTAYQNNINNGGPLVMAQLVINANSFGQQLQQKLAALNNHGTELRAAITSSGGDENDFVSRYNSLNQAADALADATEGNLQTRINAIVSGLPKELYETVIDDLR